MCYTSLSNEKPGRNFLTKKEKIEMLQEYKEDLDQETMGVSERIKQLENEE